MLSCKLLPSGLKRLVWLLTIYKESNYYFSNENKSGIMVEKKDKVVENGKEQTGTNTRINGIQ